MVYWNFYPYKVHGDSMSPTLENGNWIFVSKTRKNYAVGDIISFESPDKIGEVYVKRIVGLPGDSLELTEGILFVNGDYIMDYTEFNQSFKLENFTIDGLYSEGIIPENRFFVMGDNLSQSRDSRDFGLIDLTSINGIVHQQ